MAKFKELKILKGTTPSYELQFTKNDSYIDITGWTIYFTVKENMKDNDSDAEINKKIEPSEISDPENGKCLIVLSSSDTDLTGSYYYAIDYKDDEGNVGTLYYGRLEFKASVRNSHD